LDAFLGGEMIKMIDLDQVNYKIKKKRRDKRIVINSRTKNSYQRFICRDCNRSLRICQIQKKKINNSLEFVVFTYYCSFCKLTYYVFKFINKKRKGDENKIWKII